MRHRFVCTARHIATFREEKGPTVAADSRRALRDGSSHSANTGQPDGVPQSVRPRDAERKTGPPAGPGAEQIAPVYCVAPPSNHAASFVRSSSVMCVTLPIGIAFRRTACS